MLERVHDMNWFLKDVQQAQHELLYEDERPYEEVGQIDRK